MYDMFKNKINTYFFNNFVQKSYDTASRAYKEEVYYRKNKLVNKLVIVVRDEGIGKRIYNIIKNFKDNRYVISTPNSSFEIYKYISDNDNTIKVFYAYYTFKENWYHFSKLEKLKELVSFVDSIEKKGYVLDDSIFENEKLDCISSFLSLFVLDNGDVEKTNSCLIKYIHYIFSDGGDLEEDYQKISTKGICRIYDFPYNLPIIKMCYEYFVTHTFQEDIYDVINEEEIHTDKISEGCIYPRNYYLMLNKMNFEADVNIIEDNDRYTIYDGNIKIYHKMSLDYRTFIISTAYYEFKEFSIEEVLTPIIDFGQNIIGYEFLNKVNLENTSKITERDFKEQYEILDFMYSLSNFLFRINGWHLEKSETNFDIEKVLSCNIRRRKLFGISEVDELFNLIYCNEDFLKNQIVSVFFKIYLIYLNKEYGKMSDEEQFLSNIEIKQLSPNLVREFINYSLAKDVNYDIAREEFFEFLFNTRNEGPNYSSYDSRYVYDPSHISTIFDFELDKKYGIKFKKGATIKLSDGTSIITFDTAEKIGTIKEKNDLMIETSKKFNHLGNHVKIVRISEIIYSKTINDEGMYDIVGYITTPIKGKALTDDFLLSLNNKDFLKICGYLFVQFGKYSIPLNSIYMDDDFIFYINTLDTNFRIEEWFYYNYIEGLYEHLIHIGGNLSTFIDLLENPKTTYSKKYFLNLAYGFDSYCDEHNVYYNSSEEMCPICLKTKYHISKKIISKRRKIFEDKYSCHFQIDEKNNIKVYKKSVVDMALIEKNIDRIICGTDSSSLFHQDCFIPCKKALNNEEQFIGYVYKAVNFNGDEDNKDLCINFKDLQRLTNLPRIMCLIRLILQIKEILQEGFSFIENPFSNVFLIKSHKKQVQILNIDLLSKTGSVNNTIKWTCEYICQVLALDKSIDIDISDCSKDIDKLLIKLQALSKDMTKYCTVHKMYYNKEHLFCPKCLDISKIENIEIEKVEISEITSSEPINEGGESFIYSYSDNLVAKVFKESDIDINLKNRIIASLLGKNKILEEINKDKKLKYKYIIPQKLLVDPQSNNIFAYVMDKINGTTLSSLRDKSVVEKLGLTKKDVFEILITVGQGIEALHSKANIYIGDLNGRNILFDSKKNVYFLDFDGMGIDNIAPEFCTDGYIDPISKKNNNITMEDDWYSFAIQAFYYLTFTHPFNGIYSIKVDGKKVMLDITEKMEHKISLLGDHGITAPAVSIPWDWMSNELKSAFLNIFEGDDRSSIVPCLITQYKKLYSDYSKYLSDEPIRINQKFIATNITSFNGDVIHIINPYSAVCSDGQRYYITILTGFDKRKIWDYINFPKCMEIKNILLSEDETIAFAIYEKLVIALDLEANAEIYREEILDTRDVVVNGNTLYFTGISEGENIIFKREFKSNEEIKKERIKFLTELKTKRFYAKFNSKFVLVKQATSKSTDIYCNSMKLCYISHTSKNPEYNIVYDTISKFWLVINSEGNGIVINSNGSYEQINISDCIDDFNIENITFYKKNIFIPTQGYLYIINTNNQLTTKKMECNKIITPDSKLYNINKDGFSVLTNNTLYEVRRG